LFRNGNHERQEPETGRVDHDALLESLRETVRNGPWQIHLEEEAREEAE